MTFLEALILAMEDETLWFRPVSWKGFGSALCAEVKNKFHPGSIKLVPTPKGGVYASFMKPEIMVGKWEVISALEVNKERTVR